MSKGKRDIQYSFETSPLWRLKLRLQSSGWLQYIPPFILGGMLLLISKGLALVSPYLPAFVNHRGLVMAAIGKLSLAVGIFDVVTLKLNIRPPEPLPKRLDDGIDICSVIRQRRSCRSFQPRKLQRKDRDEILQFARIQSKQTLGTSPIRFEYVDSPLKVWPTVNAQEFLVAIGPAKYDRMAMMDVGRSLQSVVLHATKMGLGTCWIGPGADHLSVTTALKLRGKYDDERDHIVCVCAIGYKSVLAPTFVRLIVNRLSRTRKTCEELFFADRNFRIPLDTTKHPAFAKYARCYEAARWSPSSFNAQPTLCLGSCVEEGGADASVRFDFYSSTKSRYYAPVAAGIWLCDWESSCKSIGIKGRFAVLTEEKRGIENHDADGLTALPIYNISWIQDKE